jgi:hypothetical protein
MSTLPAPARLYVLFATEAPVAVVIRRGPSQWSQLILWNTDTDEFTPGQWIKDNVDYASLSPDGRYLAAGVMKDEQYMIVSRPPFFSALAISFHALCLSHIGFTAKGELNWDAEPIEWRGKGTCPLVVIHENPGPPEVNNRSFGNTTACKSRLPGPDQYADSLTGEDPRGRTVHVRDGALYVSSAAGERLLFDANMYKPTQVPPPEWALEW